MINKGIGALVPSPLQRLDLPVCREKKIQLFVKRDDLIHPVLSGNKYRKSKYNLEFAFQNNIQTIITFGGAYSNHLHAIAGICHDLGLQSIGIVRGDGPDPNNSTLNWCLEKGMQLFFVNRSDYRLKEESREVSEIISKFPGAMVIPEGGANLLALPGVGEIVEELQEQLNRQPDFIFCASGTGTTAAGLLNAAPDTTRILAFSVLKTDYLRAEILNYTGEDKSSQLVFNATYHFGGYARYTPELLSFIAAKEAETGIEIDHIYNGKALYGFFDLLSKNYFPEHSTIVWLHTGGIQGKAGLRK
jgi:1-aminocyclopropane-1-carboxylate deaminase